MIQKLQQQTHGRKVTFDQCRFGLTTYDDNDQPRPAKKTTTILTNMPALIVELDRRCKGDHRHWPLEGYAKGRGRRTTLAQIYPKPMVHAILRAVKKQLQWDERGLFLLGSVDQEDCGEAGPIPPEEETELCYDDISGHSLDVAAVRRARAEEIGYYRKMDAFEVVPIQQCWDSTGKAPISVRWLDHDKGDERRPNIRCRLVARDF